MIGLKVDKLTLNFSELAQKADKQADTAHKRIGGLTQKIAKRSIRKRQKASEPGKPPSSHYGTLKKRIRFRADRDNVVIGPELAGTKDAEPIEHGGYVKGNPDFGTSEAFLAAGFGPVEVNVKRGQLTRSYTKGRRIRVVRARLRTRKQAEHASDLFLSLGLPGSEKAYKGRRHAEPRPFMTPAFNAAIPEIEKIWKDSIK